MIDPRNFDKTIQVIKKVLVEHNWLVTDYGSEYLSEETKKQLQSNYNLTNLYVRTKPDLLAIRDGFSETYLLECKDLTKQGQKTGNLAIEAIPWFISRYLYKIGVNYLYATDLNGETKILKADIVPFTTITTIFLPSLHKEFFKKQVLSKLEKTFPQTPFNLRELEVSYGSSSDPFILIPIEMISNYGRSLERFAKWGWRDGTNI